MYVFMYVSVMLKRQFFINILYIIDDCYLYYTHQKKKLSIYLYIYFLSSHIDEEVCVAILSALIPMSTSILTSSDYDVILFPELMMVMRTLAGSGTGSGHLKLLQSAVQWMKQW